MEFISSFLTHGRFLAQAFPPVNRPLSLALAVFDPVPAFRIQLLLALKAHIANDTPSVNLQKENCFWFFLLLKRISFYCRDIHKPEKSNSGLRNRKGKGERQNPIFYGVW
jgi:hypothetical protein